MQGRDLNLLESEYHISNDKQEDASEAPDMDGNNEDSTDVVLGSNCKQALSNDDCDISGVVGTVHLIHSGVARPGLTRVCALPSTSQALPSAAQQDSRNSTTNQTKSLNEANT